ncbi:hypothetical protein OGAPHI_004917 [Ogataea philodendri]|uniref:Major facilitator superfamily (MFS) profile domain-containing protein n=1 Tax=Ogataea philodendri TaxID=1378263 RepID=A0A9P8T375_9ASCO|nr:uncharacterized protein OGAPHI_004917 [Ogataea philodendri]KAH3663516.1 hypothetical protein OGAPHI_004917 [Ogataea philodendri]
MKLYYEAFPAGRPTRIVITVTCLFSFILYGFEQGALANIQNHPVFQKQFGYPTGNYLGIIVSIYNLGSFFGCLANLYLGDRLGRKKTIWFGFTLVIIGTILQTSSYEVVQLFIGRFISGLGTGLETSTVPMFQAEVTPPEKRGGMVAAEPQGVALGISISYWIGYGCSKRFDQTSWRLPIGIQMLFAVLGWVMLFFCPESPRWLMKRGYVDDAKTSLSRINNVSKDDDSVNKLINDILYLQEMEGEGDRISWRMILRGQDAMHGRFRIFLAMLVQFWNQFGGVNLVVYYVPMVLESNVGMSTNISTILGGCIMITFFFFGFIPTLWLDKIGRRTALISGSLGQMVSMMMITILLRIGGKKCSAGSVAFFFTYMAFFGAAMNCVPWVYGAEILPLQLRAKGTAISTSTNWISNFVIAMITPIITENLGWKTYIIFTMTNAAAAVTIFLFCPETTRRTLEDIESIFLGQTTIFHGVVAHRPFNDTDVKPLAEVEHVENADKLLESTSV